MASFLKVRWWGTECQCYGFGKICLMFPWICSWCCNHNISPLHLKSGIIVDMVLLVKPKAEDVLGYQDISEWTISLMDSIPSSCRCSRKIIEWLAQNDSHFLYCYVILCMMTFQWRRLFHKATDFFSYSKSLFLTIWHVYPFGVIIILLFLRHSPWHLEDPLHWWKWGESIIDCEHKVCPLQDIFCRNCASS